MTTTLDHGNFHDRTKPGPELCHRNSLRVTAHQWGTGANSDRQPRKLCRHAFQPSQNHVDDAMKCGRVKGSLRLWVAPGSCSKVGVEHDLLEFRKGTVNQDLRSTGDVERIPIHSLASISPFRSILDAMTPPMTRPFETEDQ